ncbi:hypothetical protein SASPL_138473 [Salvia splendens]|uniref:Uncharacterized protein n=1 Tax=Salvia splendens TaxID=180675 RepID=A0A8X8ZF29_SALSN|nr:hypothetical protein SASPL_138473 [Salvia splendens]
MISMFLKLLSPISTLVSTQSFYLQESISGKIYPLEDGQSNQEFGREEKSANYRLVNVSRPVIGNSVTIESLLIDCLVSLLKVLATYPPRKRIGSLKGCSHWKNKLIVSEIPDSKWLFFFHLFQISFIDRELQDVEAPIILVIYCIGL